MSAPSIHTVNSDSTSNGKVSAAAGQRCRVGGLNLRCTQSVSLPSDLRHETLIIPSSSLPTWGGYFTVDIRERNIILNNITLQMNVSAVAGTTLVGYFSPAIYHFTRIDIVQGGNVIDTIFNNEQFLRNQLLEYDEDRLSSNITMGLYSNSTQRTLLSSQSTTNTFYIPLKTYFDECKPNLLSDQHNVQLRIYMDTLANVFTVTSGTLVSAPILSCSAICKVSRLDATSAASILQDMTLSPHHSIIHDTRYGTFTVPTGSLSSTIVLTPIVGNVTALLFTVRSATTGAGAWNYTQLASFAILDATSTNIVGGQALPASLCANILNRDWCKSSYNTETSFYSAANNAANFYMWSFSADPVAALSNGQALTSRKLTGSEQLILNFQSALGSAVTVDVYAYVESIVEQGPSHVKKMSL